MLIPIFMVAGLIIGIIIGIYNCCDFGETIFMSLLFGVLGGILSMFISLIFILSSPYTVIESQDYDIMPVTENVYWVNDNGYKSINDIIVYYLNEDNEICTHGARAEDLVFVKGLEKPYIQIQKQNIENELLRSLIPWTEVSGSKVYLPAYMVEGVTE